jgi:serine/threonine protein kinase
MFEKHGWKKEGKSLDLTCSICGKPIAPMGGSDLTRSLLKDSRCICRRPKLVLDENNYQQEESPPAQPVIDPIAVEAASVKDDASAIPNEVPAWQSAVLANLPEQYEVLAMIGEGGLGTVWKVRDKNLDQIFAVKVLRSWLIEDNNALNRFEQEAEAAHSLSHPNLATVYSFGMGKRGAPYLVMDYLEGKNLAKIIQEKGCVEVPRAINLFIQIAEAVDHAHSKDVLHRDIKPTNIIIAQAPDGSEVVKLVDFGISKVLPTQSGVSKGQARTGEVFGSPPYMSPEMCLGNQLDTRSDIYALGCVMYETLCGSPPFAGDSPVKTMIKHTEEEPLPIRKAATEQIIPHDLEYVVMHCLEKSQEDRYQSMQELADDLRRISENKPVVRVVKLSPQPQVVQDSVALTSSDSHMPQTSFSPQELDAIGTPNASFSPQELDAIGTPNANSQTDSGSRRPLSLPANPSPQYDSGARKPLALPNESPLSSDSGPYRSLASDAQYSSGAFKPFAPDSSLPYNSGAHAPLARESSSQEAESLRALDSESYEGLDPDLFRLYQAQSQTLKMVCIALVVLLAIVTAAYVSTSFHGGISLPLPTVSDRSSSDPALDQDLINTVDKAAEAFIASQQYDNAAPLLEIAVKTQQHMGTSKSIILARDQEGLGRCYAMLGQFDRAAHWYGLALQDYESLLVRSGAHYERNRDWATASTCAKDYSDILRKLNRDKEAQEIETKWINP